MSGNSSVGTAAVYEAGDQRNVKDSEEKEANRFHEGKENSHKAQDSSKPASIHFSHPLNNLSRNPTTPPSIHPPSTFPTSSSARVY
jgi:hypothetical protein